LEFISALAGSIAWPVAVVSCVVILRKHLAGLLRRLETVEVAGSKATFGTLTSVEQTIAAVATGPQTGDGPAERASLRDEGAEWDVLVARAAVAPKEAVIDAWSTLEYQLNVMSDRLDPALPHGWPQVCRNFESWSQWSQLQPALIELRRLRDATASAPTAPSSADAARYVAVARELVSTLKKVSP
jgi:hypothetical protein